MAANTVPIFSKQGNFSPVRISSGNTSSDGSGSLVTLVTSAVDGTRVDGVRFRNSQIVASIASTANVHKIFLSDTGGINFRLIGEVATPTATRTTAVIGATSVFTFDNPIIMMSGQIMAVSQAAYVDARDQFDAVAYASDY